MKSPKTVGNALKEISKRLSDETQHIDNTYYDPKEISRDTYDLLNKIWSKDRDKIFDKPVQIYVKSIKESIGNTNFDGCYIRNLGIKLKCKVKGSL